MTENTLKKHYQAISYDLFSTYDAQTNNGPHTHVDARAKGNSYTFTNQSNGVKFPGWKTAIRNHQSATTGFSYQYLDSRDSICRMEYDHVIKLPIGDIQRVKESAQGILPVSGSLGFTNPPATLVNDITNRCIRKFVDRCDAARSSFEAGQDLGELKQTIEAAIHPMKSLKNYALSYFSRAEKLKKYRKHRKTLVKALNDTYLEWTFGWNPLASDVAAGISAVQAQGSRFDIVPIRASASGDYAGSLVSTNPFSDSYVTLRARSKVVNTYSLRYKGAIKTGAIDGRIGTAQLLQLDLPHFVPTLYDLFPWSFVADYFANIGDIIKANCFRFGDLQYGCYTVKQSCREVFIPYQLKMLDLTTLGTVQYQNGNFSGGSREITVATGGRGILDSSMLMPRFTFSIPVSEKPWVNMGSLLLSQLQRVSQLLR